MTVARVRPATARPPGRASRPAPRTLATVVLAAAALIVPGAVSASGPASAPAAAQSWSDGVCPDETGVTVVVDFRSLGGQTIVRCAHGAQADGRDALRNAGVQLTGTNRWGTSFVCRLDGKPGADREPCVDTPPASAYWSYWHAEAGGSWTYSNLGVSNRTPAQGTFEGWSFYEGAADGDEPAGRLPPRVDPVRPTPPSDDGPGGGGDSSDGGGSGSAGDGSGSSGSDGNGGSGDHGSNGGSSGSSSSDGGSGDGGASTGSAGASSSGSSSNGGSSRQDAEDDPEPSTHDGTADDDRDGTDDGRDEDDAGADEEEGDDGRDEEDADEAGRDDPDTDGTTELRVVPGDELAASDVEVSRSGGRNAAGTLVGTALIGGLAVGAAVLARRRRIASDDVG